MKYKGVVELSVRKYLGAVKDEFNWEHIKYAIGINIDGRIYDYKTLEEYKFLSRNDKGVINAQPKDLIVGEIYAIDTQCKEISFDKSYREYVINNYVRSKRYFLEDYKDLKPKVKKLFKEKK